eukprot:2925868-Prymnesium_polylepis.1
MGNLRAQTTAPPETPDPQAEAARRARFPALQRPSHRSFSCPGTSSKSLAEAMSSPSSVLASLGPRACPSGESCLTLWPKSLGRRWTPRQLICAPSSARARVHTSSTWRHSSSRMPPPPSASSPFCAAS